DQVPSAQTAVTPAAVATVYGSWGASWATGTAATGAAGDGVEIATALGVSCVSDCTAAGDEAASALVEVVGSVHAATENSTKTSAKSNRLGLVTTATVAHPAEQRQQLCPDKAKGAKLAPLSVSSQSCEGRIGTEDLRVMSRTSCPCSTPRLNYTPA